MHATTDGRRFLGFCCIVLGLIGAAPLPAASSFNHSKLGALDRAITHAIAEGKIPGGVLWLERPGQYYARAFGNRALVPAKEPMTPDTIFDAASLTKVMATTPAIMLLLERGQLKLDEPIATYLVDYPDPSVTLRHLLTHSSGLRPGLSLATPWTTYEVGVAKAIAERPRTTPGTAFRYSDINFILLGEIVRRVTQQPLNEFCQAELFGPLGMTNTQFRPSPDLHSRIAPTEKIASGVLRGEVHDPTCRRMGGVAGHAGLFTTARDLARFARLMLYQGALGDLRIFKPETVRLMTTVQSPAGVKGRRGLGWDIDSPYASPRGELFPVGSYGHTGWTGTSVWIDPYSHTILIFLSNRNHPTEDTSVVSLRKELATLAAEAVEGYEFKRPEPEPSAGLPDLAPLPETRAIVRNGIDVLVDNQFKPLKKRRVGLITNHTGVDRHRRPTIDLFHEAEDVALRALFSPEHGIRGVKDEKVGDSTDEETGLPIYSLYGERRKPTPEQLAGIDTLVFDIQDIGCRFYTYVSTMGLCMEAAAEAGISFVVLDRVNPINGIAVEGPVHKGESSFVAFHSLPVRHGMTVGELARMFRSERQLILDLTIIEVQGWNRSMWFDQTGLPWINPSPNMRNLKEAILYPGVGLLERALAVGRGTDTPFEVIGAPFINDLFLAEQLHAFEIPGVRFVPLRFTPKASTFLNQPCHGVSIQLVNRDACPVVDIGFATALILQKYRPGTFDLKKFNALLLSADLMTRVTSLPTLAELKKSWQNDLDAFLIRRRPFLLY